MTVVQHFTILPCDIGAELFVPHMSGDIIRKRVQGFLVRANKIFVITEYDTEYQIGIDAFLTYPEALAWLNKNSPVGYSNYISQEE